MDLAGTNSKRVFLSPLDWGLGHCARLIPIIKQLIAQKCEVFIGVNREQRLFYEAEELDVVLLDFTGYDFKIPEKNWEWNFVLQSPRLLQKIQQEFQELEVLHKNHQFDLIISDHRYGCRLNGVQSIFLTHQLNVPGKLLYRQVNALHKKYLSQFDFVWVYDGEMNLAGKLSKSENIKNTHHIGVMSRFSEKDVPIKYDVLVIVSGPEPHRTNFRMKLLEELRTSNLRVAFLGAELQEPLESNDYGGINYVSHGSTKVLNELINHSSLIVSRCGYTTLMDVILLHKKAILCPTPGQGEQEYLYELHQGKQERLRFVKEQEVNLSLIETMLSQG